MSLYSKRKNKISAGQAIILIAFLVVICISWLVWFFFKDHFDTANYENRKMASRPEFRLETYTEFSKEYEAYFNDNIPFRNNLISLNNTIDYFAFHKPSNDEVIIGKDNWLFYGNVVDGDPVGCYQGTVLLSDEELREIADNLVRQRDFLAESGKEFVIFIAPNKERVYNEMMPDRYGEPADVYMALQVVEYLRENTDLRVVYPYEELLAAKEAAGTNIWYKTDTHWNLIGGYIGAKALLAELGIEIPTIDSDQINIVKGENVAGDLARMLSISNQLKFADAEYIVDGYDTHGMEITENNFDTIIKCHSVNADGRKLYVLRDSFASQMLRYVGSQFNDSCWRHRNTYSYEDYAEQDPDIFVYETVERYVAGLKYFSIQ